MPLIGTFCIYKEGFNQHLETMNTFKICQNLLFVLKLTLLRPGCLGGKGWGHNLNCYKPDSQRYSLNLDRLNNEKDIVIFLS